jgi:phosphatidylserine decarboxylase
MFDYIKITLQYIAPHFLITRIVYWLAQSKLSFVKNIFIFWFKNNYKVDMSLAANEDAYSYQTFNLFFTRALKPEVRPINPDNKIIISPVDGAVSQIGNIEGDSIFQAKGHNYTLGQLLAGQENWCQTFHNGHFSTLYLSPKDYHRIHMPCAGTLKQMSYVPGKLFSVSPLTARMIPGVFARNERVLCFFETDLGPVAVIMVGAMIVGGMETVWNGVITPPHRDRVNHWHYTDGDTPKQFLKGDEMGRFNIGSTIILLFAENQIQWSKNIGNESSVVVGQEIGQAVN